jgi:site-specific DNA-adenine methylase
VLFAKPPSPVEVLNDKDQELINFFRVVKEKPDELIASFEWELASRAEFERLAELPTTQLAARTTYRLSHRPRFSTESYPSTLQPSPFSA